MGLAIRPDLRFRSRKREHSAANLFKISRFTAKFSRLSGDFGAVHNGLNVNVTLLGIFQTHLDCILFLGTHLHTFGKHFDAFWICFWDIISSQFHSHFTLFFICFEAFDAYLFISNFANISILTENLRRLCKEGRETIKRHSLKVNGGYPWSLKSSPGCIDAIYSQL